MGVVYYETFLVFMEVAGGIKQKTNNGGVR